MSDIKTVHRNLRDFTTIVDRLLGQLEAQLGPLWSHVKEEHAGRLFGPRSYTLDLARYFAWWTPILWWSIEYASDDNPFRVRVVVQERGEKDRESFVQVSQLAASEEDWAREASPNAPSIEGSANDWFLREAKQLADGYLHTLWSQVEDCKGYWQRALEECQDDSSRDQFREIVQDIDSNVVRLRISSLAS